MFLNDSQIINSVMFPYWLKGSKDSVFDYKTSKCNAIFLSGLEVLSTSRFPSAEVLLLLQSAFDFPNRLFHECFCKSRQVIIC